MKYLEERIVKFLMFLSIGIVAFFVLSVLYTIFRRGLPVLSWEMVSQLPSGGFYLGGKGGFLNAIWEAFISWADLRCSDSSSRCPWYSI